MENKIHESVMLPKFTLMKQPNKVTYASYDYSAVQQKVFAFIMLYLQDSINQLFVNKSLQVNQLSLFKDDSKVEITLVLSNFCNSANYKEFIQSVRLMASALIKFPDRKGSNGLIYGGEGHLISSIHYPKVKHKKEILICLDKAVVEDLLIIKNGYTRFSYEIILTAKNKYTGRIYQLICRWRDTGGFRLKYSDLRSMLSIDEDKYKTWKDFKKRVIVPVQAELTERADVWFEVELEKGENSKYLNFKVITSEQMAVLNKKKDSIMELLKHHFGYSVEDYKDISVYLLRPHIFNDLHLKLIDLFEIIKLNNSIKHIPSYINAAIIKEFKGRLKL